MSKNILVTGANGQLGRSLQTIRSGYPDCRFYFTDVDTLDIGDEAQVADYIATNRIEYILNCAAYTAVDKAESDAESCMRVNCDAVRLLGKVAALNRLRFIHISTDYVFDGTASLPYREDDQTNPQSAYGRSKLAGEQALQSVFPDAVIIRTSWLYSEYGSNFVKTMMNLGKTRTEIKVVADQTGTPTYAGDLAVAMMTIVEYQQVVPGIYHFSDEGVCSWYDFAVKIMASAGLDCRVIPIPTSEYPTPAIRPAYSVLDKSKIKTAFRLQIPQWEESLAVCIDALQKV
ncbi:MAG: dTDP-4-dehydrorhamnose reductase [Tannerella sp.]|jgi:dTDP-4-dehydrorhamnose reductase|nr:dTDP-4-dehydrorhamnose reductase [Tannerella sp.]